MIIGEPPTGEDVREAYAQFGLAYYFSECLQSGICNLLSLCDTGDPTMMTCARMDEKLAAAYALTMGEAIKQLSQYVPDDLHQKLLKALETRNFLAHKFWFERCHRMFQSHHIELLVEELRSFTRLFQLVDAELGQISKERRKALNISEEKLGLTALQILSGSDFATIPGKNVLTRRNRILKRPQKLARVWNAGTSLVFQFADGSLWQPCEVGLGWSTYDQVQEGWTLNTQIGAHLPAEIMPRPTDCQPWNYSFELKGDATLVLEPDESPSSFRWRLTAPAVSNVK